MLVTKEIGFLSLQCEGSSLLTIKNAWKRKITERDRLKEGE